MGYRTILTELYANRSQFFVAVPWGFIPQRARRRLRNERDYTGRVIEFEETDWHNDLHIFLWMTSLKCGLWLEFPPGISRDGNSRIFGLPFPGKKATGSREFESIEKGLICPQNAPFLSMCCLHFVSIYK